MRPGGAGGIRTPDLCSAIAALSHLSYSPAPGRWILGAHPAVNPLRVEILPPTRKSPPPSGRAEARRAGIAAATQEG